MDNRERLKPYVGLIRDFASGTISAKHFEGEYLRSFKSETTRFPSHEIYEILNTVFCDVDEYFDGEPNPSFSGGKFINAEELRSRCKTALDRLEILMAG